MKNVLNKNVRCNRFYNTFLVNIPSVTKILKMTLVICLVLVGQFVPKVYQYEIFIPEP